jgi:hypothetical protein
MRAAFRVRDSALADARYACAVVDRTGDRRHTQALIDDAPAVGSPLFAE